MKREMQKWLCGVWTLVVFVMLTGCGHEHTWEEATCTVPKTCSECGKTEGEVLGHTWEEATCAEPKHCSVCGETEGESLEHTWIEATCAEPKHCSVCGETEGEALEHTWKEATYWEAKTCSVCGETEGEPLTPSFVEHGVSVMDVTVGAEYDYVTACVLDETKESVGKFTITDYQVADSYEDYDTLDGYEWRILKISIWYFDENSQKYGRGVGIRHADYYTAAFEEMSEGARVNTAGEDVFTISYLGEEYTECLKVTDGEWSAEGVSSGKIFKYITACRVPKGYDGRIVCFMNYKYHEGTLNDTLDENALVFRLK